MVEDLPAVFRTAEALSSLPVLAGQTREPAERSTRFSSFTMFGPSPVIHHHRDQRYGTPKTPPARPDRQEPRQLVLLDNPLQPAVPKGEPAPGADQGVHL
jgi:hypothetical protein